MNRSETALRTRLLAGSFALLLIGATAVVVVAGPDSNPDAPPDGGSVERPDLELNALSEPPVPDDGGGSDGENEEADGTGPQQVADAIAGEFGVSTEDVLAHHEEGIGFGALFKLYSLARAKGMTIDELLAQIESEGSGYAFGKRKKELTEEEQEILDDGPKNLGQLVSESKKNNGSGHQD